MVAIGGELAGGGEAWVMQDDVYRRRLMSACGWAGVVLFVGFGGWETARGAQYVPWRIPTAIALAILALGIHSPLFRRRAGLALLLGVATACVGLSLIGPRVPSTAGFMVGCHLLVTAVFATAAPTLAIVLASIAIQLASVVAFVALGGAPASAAQTVVFLVPASLLGLWLTRLRIQQQAAQRALHALIASERAHFEQLAQIDGLTGLLNRRAFGTQASRAFDLARRHGRALTMVVLDVDHFKKVNDGHGHDVGDRVLRLVAQRCAESVRRTDVLGRIGGEEFALLLPETDLAGGLVVAEHMRSLLEQSELDVGTGPLRVTISLGVATRGNERTLEELGKRADAALYDAKRSGRNRVAVAAAPGPPSRPALERYAG